VQRPNSFCHVQNNNSMHFGELVQAASKFEFSQDGIHAVTRDYMHTSLWDIRKSSEAVSNFQVLICSPSHAFSNKLASLSQNCMR
jgi:hypothetical protein